MEDSSEKHSSVNNHTLRRVQSGNFPEAQEYSSFTYWRNPLPDIELDLEAIKGASSGSGAASKKTSDSSQTVVAIPEDTKWLDEAVQFYPLDTSDDEDSPLNPKKTVSLGLLPGVMLFL